MKGFLALLTCTTLALRAEEQEEELDPLLNLERIYASEEFRSEGFSGRWLKGYEGYTTWERSDTVQGGRDLVLHHPETEATEILVPAEDFVPPGESSPLSVSRLSWSEDRSKVLIFTNTKRVWRTHSRGDFWVLDRSSHELYQLGRDARRPSLLQFAKFSPDGDKVAYVRENNLYVEDLHSREIRALTTDGNEAIINGTFDWVYEEEFRLRDGFRWSPDGEAIAYWQLDTRGERKFPLINQTDSLYPEVKWIQYPKVGEVNAAARIGVVSLDSAETQWLELPGDPRQHYLHDLDWTDRTGGIFLQQLNRLQNTNRYLRADPATGEVTLLAEDRDEAWIDSHEVHHLPGKKGFVWLSEQDGWRHVYLTSFDGKSTRRVTQGERDVIDLVWVDPDGKEIYYVASPENPTQRYLFRTRLDRKEMERVTPGPLSGSHRYRISPRGRWAIHNHSQLGVPPTIELVRLPGHETIRPLETNEDLREKLDQLKPVATGFFRVPIDDELEADAYFIQPKELQGEAAHPLLVYVYGEPAGQTVRDRWGGSGYLFHMMLAQQGYVVMSFDNRGTPAPRGRQWRKAVYRRIGILSPQDQAEALRRTLEQRPYIDPDRVGIWGWSGGGSSTLQALFKYPELYSMGIAIAAVPNQRYYDTIYQERYMGLPRDNVEGFLQGSPIHFAQHLDGDLLLIHGTGDDNVHYQGMEALVNALVRHGKSFRMMAYPNRSHSISEGAGTTMHLRRLMLDFIHEHLPVTRNSTESQRDGAGP